MTLQDASTNPQVAIMNAVRDLPVLVARDAGFFKDEGLELDFVTTPGMAQITTSHFVKFDSVFDRPLDSVYNEGGIDQYRMCEWGIMKRAVEADSQGLRGRTVAAASLMEPWISVAQKWGLRILIESHSTRAEAAGDELDGPTLAKMFRAQARAVELLEKDPTPYAHYLARETGGLLQPHELQTWRLLHAAPQPYTRERFDDTYRWTVKWNMTVPGATYENTVDNRAWESRA